MLAYSGRIVREQGGSVLTIASGGSINFPAGGVLASSGTQTFSGDVTFGQASGIHLSGNLETFQSGACQTFIVSGVGAQTWSFGDGTLTATMSIGRNAPTHSTSPGSLYIRSDGSVSNWYYNISTGTTGSVWRAAASA